MARKRRLPSEIYARHHRRRYPVGNAILQSSSSLRERIRITNAMCLVCGGGWYFKDQKPEEVVMILALAEAIAGVE